jgi:hypothetical protein
VVEAAEAESAAGAGAASEPAAESFARNPAITMGDESMEGGGGLQDTS